MEHYFQTIAIVLISVIFILVLKNRDVGIGQLISVLVCAMVLAGAFHTLGQVFDFIDQAQEMIDVNHSSIKTLLKCVGIALTAEIVELLCVDSGNAAIGKTLQLFATAMISYLCIPMLTELLDLIQGVLANL